MKLLKVSILLFLVVAFASCNSILSNNEALADQSVVDASQAIWKRYRIALMISTARMYCQAINAPFPCPQISQHIFQLVDEPNEARWGESKYYLNNDACLLEPALGANWSPRCTGHDCKISTLFEDFIMSLPDNGRGAELFLKFRNSPREKYASIKDEDTFPWFELPNYSIEKFTNGAAAKPFTDIFEFDMLRPPEQANYLYWETASTGFLRLVPFTRAAYKNSNNAVMSDGALGNYHVTKFPLDGAKFSMKFSTRKFGAVAVRPGEWLNFAAFQNGAPLKGWLNPGGKLSMLPFVFVLAFQPKVEIVVSATNFDQFKSILNDPSVFKFFIGGSHFAQKVAEQVSSDSEEFEDAALKQNATTLSDVITYEQVNEEHESYHRLYTNSSVLSDSETGTGLCYVIEGSAIKNHTPHPLEKCSKLSVYHTECCSPDNTCRLMILSPATFAKYKVPKGEYCKDVGNNRIHCCKIIEVPEPKYKITFISKSTTPQIIAVVNSITAYTQFDCNAYRNRYKDLAALNCEDLGKHWYEHGINEGRNAMP